MTENFTGKREYDSNGLPVDEIDVDFVRGVDRNGQPDPGAFEDKMMVEGGSKIADTICYGLIFGALATGFALNAMKK